MRRRGYVAEFIGLAAACGFVLPKAWGRAKSPRLRDRRSLAEQRERQREAELRRGRKAAFRLNQAERIG